MTTAAVETPDEMSVCGVMVQVIPEKMPEIEPRLLEIPGLEIHGMNDAGKVVVTVESDNYKETGKRISDLQNVKGVLSAAMIYQHTEELED